MGDERFSEFGSLDEVAQSLGSSPDHLRHVFKARYRISLVGWLSEVRVERAKDLLAHSSLTLADIARASAFSSPQYFSASFRRLVGVSPAAWRLRYGVPPPRRRRQALATRRSPR